MPERLFLCRSPRVLIGGIGTLQGLEGSGKQMRPLTRQPFKPRTTEELMALLSAVATAILAVIIISMLYFGRDIFVPVALAILLSFVLAPLVEVLQRIHVPRALAVVSVVILAFSLIFAMGSLLAYGLDMRRIDGVWQRRNRRVQSVFHDGDRIWRKRCV
jgi:hypothetical protein